MYDVFVQQKRKKKRMKCILPFLFSDPHFSFSAVNYVLMLLLLSLPLPLVVPLVWAFVYQYSVFFLFMTPVDVFFAGGGAEQAVDSIFSGYACLEYKSYCRNVTEALLHFPI